MLFYMNLLFRAPNAHFSLSVVCSVITLLILLLSYVGRNICANLAKMSIFTVAPPLSESRDACLSVIDVTRCLATTQGPQITWCLRPTLGGR